MQGGIIINAQPLNFEIISIQIGQQHSPMAFTVRQATVSFFNFKIEAFEVYIEMVDFCCEMCQ